MLVSIFETPPDLWSTSAVTYCYVSPYCIFKTITAKFRMLTMMKCAARPPEASFALAWLNICEWSLWEYPVSNGKICHEISHRASDLHYPLEGIGILMDLPLKEGKWCWNILGRISATACLTWKSHTNTHSCAIFWFASVEQMTNFNIWSITTQKYIRLSGGRPGLSNSFTCYQINEYQIMN